MLGGYHTSKVSIHLSEKWNLDKILLKRVSILSSHSTQRYRYYGQLILGVSVFGSVSRNGNRHQALGSREWELTPSFEFIETETHFKIHICTFFNMLKCSDILFLSFWRKSVWVSWFQRTRNAFSNRQRQKGRGTLCGYFGPFRKQSLFRLKLSAIVEPVVTSHCYKFQPDQSNPQDTLVLSQIDPPPSPVTYKN
jgi:hypothetical protein